MKITKIVGAGNDYLYVEKNKLLPQNLTEFAVKICSRHTGVGADGLIVLDLNCDDCDAKMTIFNSDGSTAKMCGNGIRGTALFLYGIRKKTCYKIMTGRRPIVLKRLRAF